MTVAEVSVRVAPGRRLHARIVQVGTEVPERHLLIWSQYTNDAGRSGVVRIPLERLDDVRAALAELGSGEA